MPRNQGKKNKVNRNKWEEVTKMKVEYNNIENREIIKKINKTRRWFIENIDKIDKTLKKLTNKKREDINCKYQE